MLAVAASLLMQCSPKLAVAHNGVLYGVRPFSEAGELTGGGTSYGLVLAEDDSYLWTCKEAVGATPYWWHRVSEVRTLAGTDQGIRITEDGGCTWSIPEGIAGTLTSFGISERPGDPDHLIATTGGDVEANHVLQSMDGGLSWTSSLSVPEAAVWRAVWSGSGDAIVAEAVKPDGSTFLYQSLDAGATWSESPRDLGGFRSVGLFNYSRDDEELWLTAQSPEGEYVLARLASDLTGEVEVLRVFQQLVTGFVEGAETLHIVVGFMDYMMWSGLPEDELVPADQGLASCLFEIDGSLWGCGGEPMHAQFSRQSEEGIWEGLLRLDDIEPRVCPEGTTAAELCPGVWEDIETILEAAVPGDDDDSVDPEESCTACSGEEGPSAAILLLFLIPGLRRSVPRR